MRVNILRLEAIEVSTLTLVLKEVIREPCTLELQRAELAGILTKLVAWLAAENEDCVVDGDRNPVADDLAKIWGRP